MKIGLTGNTGFLGNIIFNILNNDHEVFTIGRRDSFFLYDFKSVKSTLPFTELFIHCAGRAHVAPDENQLNDFFTINVTYTDNLLKSLKNSNSVPIFFLFISSVSVYGIGSGENIKEDHKLGAVDPYGWSKIQAEKLVINWCEQNNVICTILRLPLVVGQNPPGNLKAMVTAIKKGYYFNVSGGTAKKSMVLATDVARAIVKVGSIGGIYNLTDGYHPNFNEFSNTISLQVGRKYIYNLPYFLAKFFAKFGDIFGVKFPINTNKLTKIITTLTFDDSKAREAFGWKPSSVLKVFKIK